MGDIWCINNLSIQEPRTSQQAHDLYKQLLQEHSHINQTILKLKTLPGIQVHQVLIDF